MHGLRSGDDPKAFVFPGAKSGKPLSNMAFLMLLRRMGRGDLTAHGFRSSFRALAHVVGNKVEAAYRRGDLFEKRRRLMTAWADFLSRAPADAAKVVSLRGS